MKGNYILNEATKVNVKCDFYLIKGILENLLNYLGFADRYHFVKGEVASMHPKRSAKIYLDDTFLGVIGEVHPSLCKEEIYVCEISLNNELLEKKHFSKEICKLNTKEEKNNIEFGLRMHSILENIDFANPDYSLLSDFEARKVKAFIDTGILYGFIDLYKEYEFMYTSDFEYHGIIDLLIIKENENIIVDYKLKHTDDEAYLKQLAGYKKYIQKINGKKTLVYLYSILDEKLINFDI